MKQIMCKSCGGFINSGDIPKEEIAKDNWCMCDKEEDPQIRKMLEENKFNEEITNIFKKLNISGDIDIFETEKDYLCRKLIEVYEKMGVLIIENGDGVKI